MEFCIIYKRPPAKQYITYSQIIFSLSYAKMIDADASRIFFSVASRYKSVSNFYLFNVIYRKLKFILL